MKKMAVKVVVGPKTKKGKVLSDAITRYDGDVVDGKHYVEQYFFRNQDGMNGFHNAKKMKLSGREMSGTIGYVPEKVTLWTDGVATIVSNEDFLQRYKTIEGLEGLAIHALSHVDDCLERGIMVPTLGVQTSTHVNNLFPVKSLTNNEKYELWKAIIGMEDEAIATRKALEFDPYSTIAEDCEIANIFFDIFTSQIKETVGAEDAVKQLRDSSRKDYLFSVKDLHIGKDAAFLSSPNPTVREYRHRFKEYMKTKERIFFSSIMPKTPDGRDSTESFLNRVRMLEDEFNALLREMKPETREDFSKVVTAFLSKE